MFFGDDLAVELVLRGFFFREQGVAPFLEMGKAAVQPLGGAAVEPNGRARQVRQEAPVMADDHQSGAALAKILFQPLDGGQIEMVGWLVEQQNVGIGGERAGERSAAGFAAGQVAGVFRAGQAEFLDQIAGEVMVVLVGQPAFDKGERCVVAGKIRLLRQIAHHRARLHEDSAAVGLDQFGGDFQQGRLAGAIAADQRDPLAGRYRQVGAGQQRRAAKGQFNAG